MSKAPRTISDAQADALAAARSPYLTDHMASSARRVGRRAQPRGLRPLLAWYRRECEAHVASRLHGRGVWEDRDDGVGSRLGSPAYANAFRRFLEQPREADPDGFYFHPVAVALAEIDGPKMSDAWFMARYLRAVACSGFDYARVADQLGITPYVVAAYTEAALERLWRAYRDEEPARVIAS